MKYFFLTVLVSFCALAHAQTTPVEIDAGAPQTMVNGAAAGPPNWFLFYNLYQGPTSTTLGAYPIAGGLLPGATVTAPVKGGPCFSISAIAFYGLATPITWFPLESPIAPAVSFSPAVPGGCKAPLAGSTTYTVTLNVVPW